MHAKIIVLQYTTDCNLNTWNKCKSTLINIHRLLYSWHTQQHSKLQQKPLFAQENIRFIMLQTSDSSIHGCSL